MDINLNYFPYNYMWVAVLRIQYPVFGGSCNLPDDRR